MRTTRFYAVLMIMTVHWATHAAIYGALVPQAAAAVIVAEDFNRTDGFNMDSATPDVANLPGGVFRASQPSWTTRTLANRLQFGADVSLNAPLGAYFTGLLHVSADISLGNLVGSVSSGNRGVGVGFNTQSVAQWNFFTGLRLTPDGKLQFEHFGADEATIALSGIAAGGVYGLSYDVDVDTGALSAIAISGVSADYSSIVAASNRQNYFAGANNLSVFAGGTRGGQYGYVDNLLVSNSTVVTPIAVVSPGDGMSNSQGDAVPEPMPLGILAFGLGTLWMVRRRRHA